MARTNPGGRKSDKPMRDALMLALTEKFGPGDDTRKLRKVADKAVELALDGDREMIKLIFDRTDGKAVQPVAGDGDGPPILHRLEFVIVDPAG